jgi:TorA maturation chaperone TorD
MSEVDEIDVLRGAEYALLSVLLGQAPSTDLLSRVSAMRGDATPLGMAHVELADAARATDETKAGREYFNLFIGVGRGELLP